MRLFLVRHGQTEANLSGVFCGTTDVRLTDIGVAQARQIAEWLKDIDFTSATSSGLARARQTAEIVLQPHPLTATSDTALNEMHFGDWEMRHHSELQQQDAQNWAVWVKDWQHARPTAGESFPEFSTRIESLVQTLMTQDIQGNHLWVAHQGVLSLLLARLLGMPAAGMWHFHFAQDSYSVLDIQDGFVIQRAFNQRTYWQQE
ncbi:adenosylcobalamin/alpha-ribazole phosphatase [Brenneria izbisi]|uniref:Alpha-ribazole phosphatase n=1 Tax=Brenneria izbisi TaxID=2939450 RepID=A0AA41XZS7_9GAMM|nr:adenosylcobalamin/alpha-ribazole phosphatase [Brenneria izbisi]MCV9878054.1 adenosylcobalamin/alpha-ribazole phosphatase [Brenneria izbisi]MCV9881382.1 adenosylcobalamin/alpha-ribazole phosphatase [Brenneria izbisi]